MELIEGIKHIIDGNALIIMGAGASYGAKNAYGEFPSGVKLAKSLYDRCSIVPEDEKDLQDASQCFEEKFSASKLINEIRTQLTCASFTESHTTIFTMPWIRYYTTNYDEVALLAAKAGGIFLTPVTPSSDYKKKSGLDNLCMHINGYIGNLNEDTLNSEFKLTKNSYLSQNTIVDSQWGGLLFNDLETAKCIVILGLSLKYDLDLNRIIHNSDKSKILIIDSPMLSPSGERNLRRYGNVYKIGVDGFAEEIKKVKSSYTPRIVTPTDRIYEAFTYSFNRAITLKRPTPDDIFRLFLNGDYTDSLFYKEKGASLGFVDRCGFQEILDMILSGKKFVFIHADMGNGKTALLNALERALALEKLHIFTLNNADLGKISEEITSICDLSQTDKVLVIIDSYTKYLDVLKKFARNPLGNIQFVLAARSAIHYTRFLDVLYEFSVSEGESVEYDINKLSYKELTALIGLLKKYGLLGDLARKNEKDRIRFLNNKKHGNGRFQSIMLEIIKSGVMKNKIEELIRNVKSQSPAYHKAVTLVLLTSTMSLRLSPGDIERIVGIDFSSDPLFRQSESISELVVVSDNRKIGIKSPVTARYILQNISEPSTILGLLLDIAKYSVNYSDIEKYDYLLRSLISYAHINSFLKEFRNHDQFVIRYFEGLNELEYFHTSHFFWLQYAIACIEMGKFERAEEYLNTAYGWTPKDFDPFQIDNQYAHFYLERIVTGSSANPVEDFEKAHKYLMRPVISVKDNEIISLKFMGYYYRKDVADVFKTEDRKEIYRNACKEIPV